MGHQDAFRSLRTISRSIKMLYQTTLNNYDNRSTKVNAKSMNAKTKPFKSQFRIVTNLEFFYFRITTIYA